MNRYYRAADVCMVTSLHDGMNLVAKEFVAARDDERGVLLLSQFTGAAHELHEALIVNPYHVEQTAEALYRALTMPDFRAAGADAQHAGAGARLQRLSLGRPDADRCRPDPAAGKTRSTDQAPFMKPGITLPYLFTESGFRDLDRFVDKKTLFAFDLDGTLAPITTDPRTIRISKNTQKGLAHLIARAAVAIVTGRSRDDARSRLGIVPQFLIGNHGAEGLPGWQARERDFAEISLDWERQLRRLLPPEKISGIRIENKGTTLFHTLSSRP